MTHPSTQLGYAPTPRHWKRRRVLAWVIAFGVTATLVPMCIRTARVAYERYHMNALVRSCLSHPLPEVAYTDGAAGTPPRDWAELAHHLGTPLASKGTVFLRERRVPDGRRFLVAVDVAQVRGEQPLVVNFAVRVIAPAEPLRAPQHLTMLVKPIALDPVLGELTVYGGTPDPADASHFTIRYTVDDRANVIDGWLLNGGDVKLEPR